MYTLGFIGLGKMGEALLSGIITRGTYAPSEICGFEVSSTRLKEVVDKYHIFKMDSEADVFLNSRAVLLCIKPQNVSEVLEKVENVNSSSLVISICAGITINMLRKWLSNSPIIRAMPNTPALIGKGVTALSFSEGLKEKDKQLALKVFQSVGETIVVDESDLDAVTAVSGSGPAYVFLFIDSLAKAGELIGLEPEVSFKLACETAVGAAELARKSGKTMRELIEQVSSPGGTTVSALSVLKERDFSETIQEAVEAALKRAKELGGVKE